MSAPPTEARARIVRVLESLTLEERKLFSDVLRVEQVNLHNKNFVPLADLMKKVKETIR